MRSLARSTHDAPAHVARPVRSPRRGAEHEVPRLAAARGELPCHELGAELGLHVDGAHAGVGLARPDTDAPGREVDGGGQVHRLPVSVTRRFARGTYRVRLGAQAPGRQATAVLRARRL